MSPRIAIYETLKLIESNNSHKKIIPRLPIEPQFRGIAGHFQGKNYGSQREKNKFMVRSLMRKITPWIHF